MDEFKHGDYAEEGWRRVNECLRREDNSLSANLKPKKLFVLPAAGKREECGDECFCLRIQTCALTHARVAVIIMSRINCKCIKCWCAAVT